MQLSVRRKIGSGGNGGKGGDVILRVSPHHSDLIWFRGRKEFIAMEGERGGYNNCKGKDSPPFYVDVPRGTFVFDLEYNLIVDLVEKGQEFIICHGGKGGEGNFKKFYTLEPGPGEEKEVVLDYRIPARAAFLGFANSGKTLLFNKLTGKNFKVADYPFTTQSPVWADCEYEYKLFTLLDNPPLKAGHGASHAHNRFLRHLCRPPVLVFISDSVETCKDDFKRIEKEIVLADESLLEDKKIFYVLNKADTFKKFPRGKKIFCVSALTGAGVEELRAALYEASK